jgi:hypothetical protein
MVFMSRDVVSLLWSFPTDRIWCFNTLLLARVTFFVEMFIHANRCSGRVPPRIRRIDQQQNEPRCGTATIAAPRRPRWSIHNQPPVPLYFLVLLLDKRLLWLWQSYEIILAKCREKERDFVIVLGGASRIFISRSAPQHQKGTHEIFIFDSNEVERNKLSPYDNKKWTRQGAAQK